MTIFELVQGTVIAIVVAASALHVARKLLPNWMRSKQVMLASALSDSSHASFVRRFGTFMQPAAKTGGGCGSGCNTCSTCESNPQEKTQAETKPLEFQRHI